MRISNKPFLEIIVFSSVFLKVFMTPRFHFISGLPRSGSTMLSALLRQNPRFHASMTSGLGALINGTMQIMSPGSEVALTLQDGQREDILKSLFSSYYKFLGDKHEVIFDTNRLDSEDAPSCLNFPGKQGDCL